MTGNQAWRNAGRPAADRVTSLLAAMTVEHKIALARSDFAALAEFGVPSLEYTDSGNGIRGAGGATGLPVGLALAATFDVELAEAYGGVLGREARSTGHNVLLGPAVDIVRTPLDGRAAEAVGEDPCLAGAIAASVVRGVQQHHVVAMPKHFVANNQEHLRTGWGPAGQRGPAIDVAISERALQEIYFPPARRALLDGGALAVMGSYNRINGEYVCQSQRLLSVLKDDWSWPGFVVPDFIFAVRDDVAAARAGLDIGALDGPGLRSVDDFTSGRIPVERLDDMVSRILYGMFAGGLFDHPLPAEPDPSPSSPQHIEVARRVATNATVLLVNRNDVLPLSPSIRSIAVAGMAGENALYVIGGSGSVELTRERTVTPLAGLNDRAGPNLSVRFAEGSLGDARLPRMPIAMRAEYWNGAEHRSGEPTVTALEAGVDVRGTPAGRSDAWAARWTGTFTPTVTGPHRFSLFFAGVADLYVDGDRVVSGFREAGCFLAGPELPMQAAVGLQAGRPVDIRVEYHTGPAITIPDRLALNQFGEPQDYGIHPLIQLGWQPPDARLADAARLAAESDVAVVVVGAASGEGMDRDSLAIPGDQDALVSVVAAANPRTVVVLNTPGPVLMPWLDDVAAVLQVWYPGEQFGSALAAILFGDADPGGRLPVTFAAAPDQGPTTTPERYPGVGGVVRYDEGPLVGYRFFDAHDQRPLFPFGHGLSYGRYVYENLRVSADSGRVSVSVDVTNVGDRAGSEIVQVYVSPGGSAPQALKGFGKVRLAPGQSAPVVVELPPDDLPAGEVEILVGASSRDVRQKTTVKLGTDERNAIHS
jgi:beta-glucosidase